MIRRGVYFFPVATKQCSISLAHTEEEIEITIWAFGQALDESDTRFLRAHDAATTHHLLRRRPPLFPVEFRAADRRARAAGLVGAVEIEEVEVIISHGPYPSGL